MKFSKSKVIKQGELYFILDPNNIDCVQCWLGEPEWEESEFIFSIHKMYLKDMIVGLKALNN